VFAVYGEEEIFQNILDQYGHQVIPVITFFVENGSLEFQVRQSLGEAWQQLWAGKPPKWEPAKITREQIGLIAIYYIAARGHEMFGEFEIVDGVAKRKPITRVILGLRTCSSAALGIWREFSFAAKDCPHGKRSVLPRLTLPFSPAGLGPLRRQLALARPLKKACFV
jgi:hypothetical protein